jgi:hypothetical protein
MNPVVDYRAQKEDPYRIRITAGGNLINYESNESVQTADLDTAKIHWNSVVSTSLARYMCLDIKNFYLMVALEYFEYSRMPLSLFPAWIIKQYNMEKHSLNGSTWRCGKQFEDCPRRAYLQTNACSVSWPHLNILKVQILQDCGTTNHAPSRLHWWWTTLELNMRIKTMWIT